jgi:cysteine-rich repeat protein
MVVRVLGLLIAVFCAAPAGASLVQPAGGLQISNNSLADTRPRVAGDNVAWQRGPDASGDIVRWESTPAPNGTTEDVAAGANADYDPRLSESFLIWKRAEVAAGSCTLRVFDFDVAPVQLGSSFTCEDDIRVAGPHIGWIDDGSGLLDDVFVSTDLADPEQLGRSNVDEAFVRVGNVAGAPRAVFIDEDDIVYWNGSSETALAPEPGSNALRAQLQMSGSRAVWVDTPSGEDDFEIYYFNGATVDQLTENDYDDIEPQIHASHVVWTGYPDGTPDGGPGEIFHYDGTTIENITNDALDDFAPQVSQGPDGPTIAWVKDGGDTDVWMFDGCESTQVNASNSVDEHSPALDGNRVAWVRGTGTSQEVYTARVTCDVVCGNGETEPGEECDDGNTDPTDGCAECLEVICGNARVDPGEECDDGNTVLEDRCDAACQLECGNDVLDPLEECDDGNRDNGDTCDAECYDEVCGNGHLQPHLDEECDDGNTVSDDGCSATCETEGPAPVAEQRCIQKLNEAGAAVVKAQHGVDQKCLSDAAKGNTAGLGVPATAQDCLTNDPKGKVAKARAKTLSGESKKCAAFTPATLFAYEGGAVVNAVGPAEAIALVGDLFGPDLGAVTIPKALDKKGAKCQAETLKAANTLMNRLFKLTVKEKKALLAGKPDGTLARSDAALQLQLEQFLASDPDGKIEKKEVALREAVRKSCAATALDAAFPGCAPSATLNELSACANAAARCRFCRAFNAFDGLAFDCDAIDDATANASCP